MMSTLPDGNVVFHAPFRFGRWRVGFVSVALLAPAVALALRFEWRVLGVAALLAVYVPALLFATSHYLAMVHVSMYEAGVKRDYDKVDSGARLSSLIRVACQGFWALLAMWAVPKFAAADQASLVPAVILAGALALQPMIWIDALSWGDVHLFARAAVLIELCICAALVLTARPHFVYLFFFASVVLLPAVVISGRLQSRAAARKQPYG